MRGGVGRRWLWVGIGLALFLATRVIGYHATSGRPIRVRVVNRGTGRITALDLEYPQRRPLAAALDPGESREFLILNPPDNRVEVRFLDPLGREAVWGAENDRLKRMIDSDLELVVR